jgi:hypothetical protein
MAWYSRIGCKDDHLMMTTIRFHPSPVSGVERRDDPLVGAGVELAVAGRPAERRQDDLGQVPEVEGARAPARAAGARAG